MAGVGARIRPHSAQAAARSPVARQLSPAAERPRPEGLEERAGSAGLLESILWPVASKAMWWRRLHRPEVRLAYELLGDTRRYQWPALERRLSAGSIVYSFGLGQNASFELELMRRTGCEVFGFDPTPSSAAWVAAQELGQRFHFIDVGIADMDGELRFFAPDNPDHISYSIRPGKSSRIGRSFGTSASREGVTAKVMTLASIMRMLAHSKIDMLKMDIEGAEDKVIQNLSSTSIRPEQFLVEFHHGFYGISRDDVRSSVGTMREMGYKIFWVSDRGLEYGFIHRAFI